MVLLFHVGPTTDLLSTVASVLGTSERMLDMIRDVENFSDGSPSPCLEALDEAQEDEKRKLSRVKVRSI